MPHNLQRDPFDDGLETVISAMKIDKRLPGPKDENLQSLGKKIINNTKTRPEFARKVSQFYTNEDSWLSGFLKKVVASAKPAITPVYNGGGSVPGKSDEPDQDIMSEVGEGGEGGESGSEEEGEGEEAEITIQEVEGDFDLLEFEELTTISREDQVKALSHMYPENATDIVIEKKGKASAVKIYVNSQEDIAAVKAELKEKRRLLKQENHKRNINLIKTLNYILNSKTSIKVTPSNIKTLSPKQKGSPKKRGRPPKQKSGGGSRSRSASSEKPSGGGSTDAQMAVYGELTKE